MTRSVLLSGVLAACAGFASRAAEDVAITGMPDYDWHAGCFGTASGNVMGYWDRNGFPDFYTGPTGAGLAPLNSFGVNQGIRSMWASRAGFDGRPADMPGHGDDYWAVLNDTDYSYQSTADDPYLLAGRPEHTPDCLCDFMGASQKKWTDLNGECAGNIDAFAFNYWDKSGAMRTNFVPPTVNSVPGRDVQSGLRAWTQYRGYDANVLSQLVEFNPNIPADGHGFTFNDLKAEIRRGYPVILMLQNPGEFYRDFPDYPHANPEIHAMVAFHYKVTDDGTELVQFRTSWASGEANESWALWGPQIWAAEMPLRGVILFHPLPKVTSIERANGKITVRWDGPNTVLWDDVNQASIPANSYMIEEAASLGGAFVPIGEPTTERQMTFDDPGGKDVFFRVRLASPAVN